MDPLVIRALLVGLAVLAGCVAALVAGILARVGGASVSSAVRQGGIAFASAVTLAILVLTALGLVG